MMQFPEFFKQIPSIKCYDPLSELLGSFTNGYIEYNYLDVVKLAGHSCPIVAGAYLVTYKALENLYQDSLPHRGQIKVEFKDKATEGNIGVIAGVISLITGAANEMGFKGIQGKYMRHSLLQFEAPIDAMVKFTRLDNLTSVKLNYNSAVPVGKEQQKLFQNMLTGVLEKEDLHRFRDLWQERVRKILIDHFYDENQVQIIS